ncbi:MAG TPA: hypothetical protein PKU94_07680 [Candidatus Hydrothermia bacterium]|nr:hypothetical protein [Candidatus Hydrothermia bacterium]
MHIELVRAGKFGDVEITEKDIEELAENFKGEVPVTIGHSLADYMPAVGWVKSVKKLNGSLVGEVELNDLVKEAYESGLYKKWSVGIRKTPDGEKYLHHLALLGAVPPKIKDLKAFKSVEMSDFNESWTFDLAETPPPLDSLEVVDADWDVTSARKRVFEKYGIEGLKAYCLYRDPEEDTENKTAYKFLVVDIIDGKPVIVAKALSSALAYLHGARGVNIPESVREKVEPKIKKLQKKQEDKMSDEVLKQKDEIIRKLQQEILSVKKQTLKDAITGKVPHAKHDLVYSLADSLSHEETIELSDEQGKRQISAIDLLIEIFRSIPLPVRPGELDMADFPKDEGIDARKLIKKI